MSLKSSTELTATEAAAPAGVAAVSSGVGRRRLLRAGLAATPVVLAVSGRSAMASTACPTKGLSPMAWHSLTMGGTRAIPANCSHTVTPAQGGNSPGGWKPQSNGMISPSWPATCVPFAGYQPGGSSTSTTNFNTGTKFNQIFVGSSYTQFASNSFSSILQGNQASPSLSSSGSVEFHLCAAYLNALTVPGYALTIADVLALSTRKIGTVSVAAGATGDTLIKDFIQQTYH